MENISHSARFFSPDPSNAEQLLLVGLKNPFKALELLQKQSRKPAPDSRQLRQHAQACALPRVF
ncbi:MAG: hypothetical protein WCU88_02420 [Elusimicrobiota bacterium]|jgi:hypothetical protein